MTRAGIIASIVAVAREKQITVNSASLAFYGFNSLLALAVLIYSAFTLSGTGNALAVTLETLTGVGAVEFQRVFEQVGGDAEGRRRAVVLASAISVWSSLRLFRAVESVFVEVYEVREERSLLSHLVDSALVLVAVAVTVVVMIAVGSLFLFRTTGVLWTIIGPFALWAALVVLFLPMYYTFSGDGVPVREALPGAAFAAAGWTVSAAALRVYLRLSESVDVYGAVGAVLLVLSWLYLVCLSLLLGVVLNALLAGRIEADRDWHLLGG